VTSLPSLLFVSFLGPVAARMSKRCCSAFDAFSCGAIIAVAFFLLLPESFVLLSGIDEVTRSWAWGSALIVGWLVGLLLHELFDSFKASSGKAVEVKAAEPGAEETGAQPVESPEAVEAAQPGTEAEAPPKRRPVKWGLAGPVLLADIWHSLIDGMVIGFSAKVCSPSALWAVVAATLAHEAPQEIADYLVLITKADMSWKLATLTNFGTALPPSVIGACIAYQVTISDTLQGLCLAFGAGVFLFVALTELGHSVIALSADPFRVSAMRMSFFIVGIVSIGAVLGSHEHCGPSHSHAH